jgi:uncharacterized protein YqgV (UPF0045/DUF77 family)
MLVVEFAVYPFREGAVPPRHVQAAIEAVRRVGLEVELAPLGLEVKGETTQVLDALRAATAAALEAGATKVVSSLRVNEVYA